MKKYFIHGLFTAFLLFLTACELFNEPADPNYLDNLYEEIAYANAPWVPLRIETGILGTASLMGSQPRTVKLGYSFTLVFQPSREYPFIGWQAWVEGEGVVSYWRPDYETGAEKVLFAPKNSERTEVEIFVYEMPPSGKQLFIGPIGAEGADINVTLFASGLGNIFPATLTGIKRGFPFTLNYQPKAQYPFEYWEARWQVNGATRSLLWRPGIDYGETEPEVIFLARDAAGLVVEVTIMIEPDDGEMRIGPAGADSRILDVGIETGELGFALSSVTETDPAREGFPFTISFQPLPSYQFRGWQAKYTGNDGGEHLLSNWLSWSGQMGTGSGDKVFWNPGNVMGTDIQITVKFLPEDADYGSPVIISPLNADSPVLENVEVDSGRVLNALGQEIASGLGAISHTISQATPARMSFPFSISFQPHGEYPFQGWQAVFSDGTQSVWRFGDGEQETNGVLWMPRNASGTEISVTIESLPAGVSPSAAIKIFPLGGDSPVLNIQVESGGLGTINPSGSLSNKRQDFPFTVSFQPLAEYPFLGWQASFSDGAMPSTWAIGSGEWEWAGVKWSPQNASGTDMSITVVTDPGCTITVKPLGGDSDPADVTLSVPSGWGTSSPPPGALVNRRQTFPFGVEFTPTSSWAFVEWRSYLNYVNPSSPGTRITNTSVVNFYEPELTKTQVIVNTPDPVYLVPWCEERPYIDRSNPSLLPSLNMFPFDQTVSIWFNDTIDTATVRLGNADSDTVRITAYSNQALPMSISDGKISDYFDVSFAESNTRMDLTVKENVPASDLKSITIRVTVGPGIKNATGATTKKKNTESHQMAEAQTLSYATNITESQKLYEAFNVQASRTNGSGYFSDAGTQWNSPLIDRRFGNKTGNNTVYVRFNVSAPEGVLSAPDSLYLVEQRVADLNGNAVFSQISGTSDFTTGGGYYNIEYALPTATLSGIIRLIILPYSAALPLAGSGSVFNAAVDAAVAAGRYVTVVKDAAPPAITSGSVTNISGHNLTDAGVYIFGKDPKMTVSLYQLNLLVDNGAGNGIPAALAWNRPWTMDDRENIQWKVLVGTTAAVATDKTLWLDLYTQGGDPNNSDAIDIGSITNNVEHTVWVQFKDRMDNESILYDTGRIKRIELVPVEADSLEAEVNASGNQITISWNTPVGMVGAYVIVDGAQQGAAITGTGTKSHTISIASLDVLEVKNGAGVSNVRKYTIGIRTYNDYDQANVIETEIWNIPGMSVSGTAPLNKISNQTQLSTMLLDNSDVKYVLVNNIALSSWEPIGTGSGEDAFQGKFYGNGHTITVNSFANAGNFPNVHAGLFGYVQDAEIRDLCVEYAAALTRYGGNGELNFGGIAGRADGNTVIRNVSVGKNGGSMSLTNSYTTTTGTHTRAGIITGWMEPTVLLENCYAGLELIIDASGYSRIRAGGITGYISALPAVASDRVMIDKVTVAGIVDAQSTNTINDASTINLIYLGGIAGDSFGLGIIQNSDVTGTLKMSADSIATNSAATYDPDASGSFSPDPNKNLDYICGGIIGKMKNGHITNCRFSGEIEPNLNVGRQNIIGGIAGAIGKIFDSFEDNTVPPYGAGDITAPVTVKDSTVSGNILVLSKGTGKTLLGGAFGTLWGASGIPITIRNCEYSDGNIDFKKNEGLACGQFGGFVGECMGYVNFENCRSRANKIDVEYSDVGGGIDITIGGFAGLFRGYAEGCYSTSSITAKLGGKTEQLTSIPIAIGGFLGKNTNHITIPPSGYWLTSRCYATGDVKVIVSSTEWFFLTTGGFIGYSSGPHVRDCYATGNVTVERSDGTGNTYTGGLIGQVTTSSRVERCFSKGTVSSKTNSTNANNSGGLLGESLTSASLIRNNVVMGSSVTRINGQAASVNYNTPRRISNANFVTGFSKNYALDTLIQDAGSGSETYPSDRFHNERDGADASVGDLADVGWWRGTVGFSSADEGTWDYSGLATRLHPILRGVGEQE